MIGQKKIIIYRALLFIFSICFISLLASCSAVTSARPSMKVQVKSYFDEDGHEYPNLDDRIFRLKMRATGVLTPQKFVKEIGFWIFLTEPHDPGKIPVVFLHGHWTGPTAFKELAASIDREKYEPWFTYYPTGLEIKETVAMFRLNLARLANYYEQDKVVLVAYSMGGLIAKEALSITDDGIHMPDIPLLIGIANPWGGSIKTTTGAKTSITASPDRQASYGPDSWKQLTEEADYIQNLFDTPFPDDLEFHIIYGLGGDDEDIPGPDDGTLTERSLARPEAVEQADSVTVFQDLSHKTIITDKQTIDLVNEKLSGAKL